MQNKTDERRESKLWWVRSMLVADKENIEMTALSQSRGWDCCVRKKRQCRILLSRKFSSKCLMLRPEHTGKRPNSKSYCKGQPNKYMENNKTKRYTEKHKARKKQKKVQAVFVRYRQSERLKVFVEISGLMRLLGTLFQMDTTECLKEDLWCCVLMRVWERGKEFLCEERGLVDRGKKRRGNDGKTTENSAT